MKFCHGLTIAVAAAVLPLALVACGGGGGGNEGAGTTSTPEAKTLSVSDAQNAKGNVTWCIGADTTGAFKQMVDLHNQQSSVTAKLVQLPQDADEQRTQLVQRLRAKSPECDVLGIDPIWMAEFASQGWLYDLTDGIENRSAFIPSVLATSRYNGKDWAIPFNTNAGFLYYRTDQVKSAPKTWQQVYQEAQQDNGLVYQGKKYEGLTVNFLELYFAAGGKVLSDDGKSVEIDNPTTTKVLQFMQNGIKDGAVPKAVTTYDEQPTREAFEAGKGTFMRNWPYAYALGQQSPIKGKFNVQPLPGWEGNPAVQIIGGYDLAVSAYSDNPNAALEFANFVSKPEPQKIMMTKSTLPAVLKQTYDDPAVKKGAPFANVLREAIAHGKPRPISPVYPQITAAIYDNVYSVLNGGADPKAATQKMSDQIEQALKTF